MVSQDIGHGLHTVEADRHIRAVETTQRGMAFKGIDQGDALCAIKR